MQNDLKYQVRSREIIDLVAAMRAGRLTLTPYFQRNLVWRDAHKKDFIETILKGYPFPQIFLARGPINLETLEADQCVVDGQQRLNAIRDFVSGELDVNGQLFSTLDPKKKEEFLKYEVAVIDFDLDAGDSRLKEVFHRLNRTYYSLSAIEKISSEFSASEFLLVARTLSGEIHLMVSGEIPEEEMTDDAESDSGEPISRAGAGGRFLKDPDISDESWAWLEQRSNGSYKNLLKEGKIFTEFEFARKVPLMFTLNVMCTYLTGYYNRNDKVRKYLEDKNSEFPEKQNVFDAIESAAAFISAMNLDATSMWWSKANFFTLICELMKLGQLDVARAPATSARLNKFAAMVPTDYALAAREAVGRKRERDLRGKVVADLVGA